MSTSFEAQLKKLEDLVETLGEEDTDLKSALAAYEESQHIIQAAQKTLAEAQARVETLTASAEGFELAPFESEDL